MTDAQRVALQNARRAIRALSDEPPASVSGAIRQVAGGFEIRFTSAAGVVLLVRTAADGTVETVDQVH